MIGLYDYDLQEAVDNKLLLPNLEIMKLYNYYKLEENKFCRLVSSNDNIKDYEVVYCFSEKEE